MHRRFGDDPAAADDKPAYLPPPLAEEGAFKTPSLRNVALTGPYMREQMERQARGAAEVSLADEAGESSSACRR